VWQVSKQTANLCRYFETALPGGGLDQYLPFKLRHFSEQLVKGRDHPCQAGLRGVCQVRARMHHDLHDAEASTGLQFIPEGAQAFVACLARRRCQVDQVDIV
jgi:hypothetical protein